MRLIVHTALLISVMILIQHATSAVSSSSDCRLEWQRISRTVNHGNSIMKKTIRYTYGAMSTGDSSETASVSEANEVGAEASKVIGISASYWDTRTDTNTTYHMRGIQLTRSMETSNEITIQPHTEVIAWQLVAHYADKSLGFDDVQIMHSTERPKTDRLTCKLERVRPRRKANAKAKAAKSAKPSINPRAEAESLHADINRGNEQGVVDVLARRSSNQRGEIARAYKSTYGVELEDALDSEFSGDFRDMSKGLCWSLWDYDAKCLYNAVDGSGTDDEALIDVLSTRNNTQIEAIKASYRRMFNRDLETDIRSDVTGDYSDLLVSILMASRDESPSVSRSQVAADIEDLYQAGENKFGTDEATFTRIFGSRSYRHIAAIATEYERRRGTRLYDVVDDETSGNYCALLLSILSYAMDPVAHVAKLFYESMDGSGTNDSRLQRTMIANCESTDRTAVKAAFRRQYSQDLIAMIRDDTSDNYTKILLVLFGEY